MPKMTKGQRNGHVGEARVFLKLCEWGCSANYLTQSDFGLDIHVQIPKSSSGFQDFFSPDNGPATDKWLLDGKFIHLQVKYRSGGRWTPRSAHDKDQISQWVSSSESGIPTFLVVVDKKRIAYADAAVLNNYIEGKAKSFSRSNLTPFEGVDFLLNAHLWTYYPLLMSELSLPPSLDKPAYEYLEDTLQGIARGECIKQRINSEDYDSIRWQLEQIFDFFINREHDDYDSLLEKFIEEAIPPWAIYADSGRECEDNSNGWSCNNATVLPMPHKTVLEGLELAALLCRLREG